MDFSHGKLFSCSSVFSHCLLSVSLLRFHFGFNLVFLLSAWKLGAQTRGLCSAQRSESAASWLAGQGYHSHSRNIVASRDIKASRDIMASAGMSRLAGISWP